MNRMRELRLERGMNMKEAASALQLPYTTYVNYEKGTREPNSETLISIAKFYRTTIEYLLGGAKEASVDYCDNCQPLPLLRTIPLLGNIACGTPILAEENTDGFVPMPDYIHADFALRCKGDSMIGARILDGDIVYIRKQPDVEDGQIAAVLIGEEATLKRVYKIPGRLQLRPENPCYSVMEYADSELEQIKILGLAVYFTSPIK